MVLAQNWHTGRAPCGVRDAGRPPALRL